MIEIFEVKTEKDIELVRELFAEYTDTLGIDLGFQNLEAK